MNYWIYFAFTSLWITATLQSAATAPSCAFRTDPLHQLPYVYHGPPFDPNSTFPPGFCQRYQNYSCCSLQEVTQLTVAMNSVDQAFRKCPACRDNIVNLWCAYTCDPYQGSFVDDVTVTNTSDEYVVKSTNFWIASEVAGNVYASCEWVEVNGAIIRDIYPDASTFFSFISSFITDQQVNITVSTEKGLSMDTEYCIDRCTCQNCQAACDSLEEPILYESPCMVSLFNQEWTCLSVGLASGYIALVLLGFIVIVIGFFINRRTDSLRGSSYSVASGTSSIQGEVISKAANTGFLERYWVQHGRFVARHPYIVILVSFIITGALGAGLTKFSMEDSPDKLWTLKGGEATVNKAKFEQQFGTIATSTLIITADQPVLSHPVLLQVLRLQQEITNLQVTVDNQTWSYQDICHRQSAQSGCQILSVLQFWQNNETKLNATTDPVGYIKNCTHNILTTECLDSNGFPMTSQMQQIFGGYDRSSHNIYDSKALIINFITDDYEAIHKILEAWEEKYLSVVSHTYDGIKVAFSTSRSFSDFLGEDGSVSDDAIIITYAITFVYVSVCLGSILQLRSCSSFLVNTKFTMGLASTLMAIFSLIISGGLCSFAGLKANVVVRDVIPVLILSIGIDSNFLLVNQYRHLGTGAYMNAETRLGETLSMLGSSITLSSLCKALALILGCLTKVPAMESFAFFASAAIFFGFLLNVTCFCAIMVLDDERVKSKRADCFPCVTLRSSDEALESNPLISKHKARRGVISQLIKRNYAPFLMFPIVKVLVFFLFVGLLFISVNYATQLSVGFDPKDALPKDSYLVNYLDARDQYVQVGPELYLVFDEDFDYSNETFQNQVCSIVGCNENSVENMYAGASYMSAPVHSWLGDYLNFAESQSCCMVRYDGSFCTTNQSNCTPCFHILHPFERPVAAEFYKYLSYFLNSTINPNCALEGSIYQADVNFFATNNTIPSSRLTLRFAPLKTQDDQINAMKMARALAEQSQVSFYPYSEFFEETEQYIHIEKTALLTILVTLGACFFLACFLLKNPWLAFLIAVMVAMVEADLMAVMQLWSISLNAISIVNMTAAIGISIEFCAHIAYAFDQGVGSRDERVKHALVEVGSSIFCGMFFIKFAAIILFSIVHSTLLEVFYFRMYLAIALLSFLHGFMFFPIVLSLVGTPTAKWLPCDFSKREYRY